MHDCICKFSLGFASHKFSSCLQRGSKNHCMLYTLTISGVAYLIRLKSIDSYENCSILGSNDVVEYNTQMDTHFGAIIAVAASSGCLVVGRNDGSVSCIQLGLLNPGSPGKA